MLAGVLVGADYEGVFEEGVGAFLAEFYGGCRG